MTRAFIQNIKKRWKQFSTAAVLLILLVLNCRHAAWLDRGKPVITKAVYSWENSYYFSAEEDSALHSSGFSRVYSKILEIGWNPVHGACPTMSNSILYWQDNDRFQYIPVVFITNEAILNTPGREIDSLAARIVLKTAKLCYLDSVSELQLDCDWSKSSRDKYFELIRGIKKRLPTKQVSVTLRLHQYKYRDKQGIPPADKCMLMLYNMGSVTDYSETNSIYNPEETMKYLDGVPKYPVHLDMAMPAFGWGIVFRNHSFLEINHTITKPFADTCSALERISANRYRVKKDYMEAGNSYLRFGDEIRVETITGDILRQAYKAAQKACNSDSMIISWFDKDSPEFYTEFIKSGHEKIPDPLW